MMTSIKQRKTKPCVIVWNKLQAEICRDDVIKWKHFPRYWPFERGNSPVTGEFPAQRPVMRSFDVSLICAWVNGWVTSREAGDLRRHRAHYDVIVLWTKSAKRFVDQERHHIANQWGLYRLADILQMTFWNSILGTNFTDFFFDAASCNTLALARLG